MNLKSLLSFEHRLVRTARSALLTSDSAFRTAEAFPGSFYVVASCRAAHFFCKGSELIHRKVDNLSTWIECRCHISNYGLERNKTQESKMASNLNCLATLLL